MKEISATESVVVAGVIAGINSTRMNQFFPFGAQNTMLGNMKSQIMNMARNIQKAK